jgi:hypothetical protein
MGRVSIERFVINSNSFIEWVFPSEKDPTVRIKYGPFALVYSPLQIAQKEHAYLATQLETHRLFGETFVQFVQAVLFVSWHSPEQPSFSEEGLKIEDSRETASSLDAFIRNNQQQALNYAKFEAAFSYGHYLLSSALHGQAPSPDDSSVRQLATLAKKFADGNRQLKEMHQNTAVRMQTEYLRALESSPDTRFH